MTSAQTDDEIAQSKDRIRRAFEALRADYERQGAPLFQHQVDRLIDRRNLDPSEALALLELLLTADIPVLDTESPETAGVNGPDLDLELQTLSSSGGLFGQLRDIPLLTAEQERRLGRRIQRASQTLHALNQGTLQSNALVSKVLNLGKVAHDKLVVRNLRLVIHIARKYLPITSLDLDDLVQEGTLGLIRAADKFDHSKGFKFSTYATWWIRQSITRAIADKDSLIRLPVHRREDLNKLSSARRALTAYFGRQPCLEELAHELDWDTARAQFFIELQRIHYVSLHKGRDNDDVPDLEDILPADVPGPDEEYEAIALSETIENALQTLTDRERTIIELRFGLNGLECTLEQIGQAFGVTRERIRQIENKALQKLGHPGRCRSLSTFLANADSNQPN